MISNDIVIITGADTPTGLTTARALRRLPVRIWGVTALPMAACCSSNIWHRLITVSHDADQQLNELLYDLHFLKTDRKPILLLSQDDLVQAASNRRDELENLFELLLPTISATNLMLDKTLFQTWAQDQGYSVPSSFIISNNSELLEVVNNLSIPFIIKPLFRTSAWNEGMNNEKCLWVDDIQSKPWEGKNIFNYCDRYIVQSWIEGDDDDVYFCLYAMDENSNVLDEVCGRKLTQWPKLLGSTAICHTIDNPYLLDIGREILQKAGLKGLGSIEFKQDKRDGVFYITEPTVGRNDHQSAIALTSGHNPTAALISHLLKLDSWCPEYRHKRSALWIDELATLRFHKKEKSWIKLMVIIVCNLRYGFPRLLLFELDDMKPFRVLLNYIFKRFKKNIL